MMLLELLVYLSKTFINFITMFKDISVYSNLNNYIENLIFTFYREVIYWLSNILYNIHIRASRFYNERVVLSNVR